MPRSAILVLTAFLATTAEAHEIILEFPDFQLSPGESFQWDIPVEDDDPGVVTLYFSGDFSSGSEGDSWASDLQLHVAAPDAQTLTIGGADNLKEADEWWDFQGPISEPDGSYASLHQQPFSVPPSPPGLWQFSFTNDRLDGAVQSWSDVEIWLIPATVPAPPVTALFAAAAAASGRRRRRRQAGMAERQATSRWRAGSR